MGQRLAPSVQDRRQADFGAEVFRVAGNGCEGLDRCFEQHGIDDGLVLVGDGGDGLRQREHDMEVKRRATGRPGGPPTRGRAARALTLGAMPIAAAVISDLGMAAGGTALDVAAERGRPARLDRCHDSQLTAIEMTAVSDPVGLSVVAEDVRHLELSLRHVRWAASGALAVLSPGHHRDRQL